MSKYINTLKYYFKFTPYRTEGRFIIKEVVSDITSIDD